VVKFLKKIRHYFSQFLFDPVIVLYKLRALPDFISNFRKYRKANKVQSFRPHLSDMYFTTYEKHMPAGVMRGHYFFQDIWAAQKVYDKRPFEHVDVASRIDGFIAHIVPFTKVKYVDIRKMDSTIANLSFVEGSLISLPFEDNSIRSLSCLHVIEHIGLGRYGDPIDPEGYIKAAKELSRVLAPGGTLFLGTPVGKEKVCYDAHRIFAVSTILEAFKELTLTEFSLIDDSGTGIIHSAKFDLADKCEYGCGLFEFKK
jgi:hypothetical protein